MDFIQRMDTPSLYALVPSESVKFTKPSLGPLARHLASAPTKASSPFASILSKLKYHGGGGGCCGNCWRLLWYLKVAFNLDHPMETRVDCAGTGPGGGCSDTLMLVLMVLLELMALVILEPVQVTCCMLWYPSKYIGGRSVVHPACPLVLWLLALQPLPWLPESLGVF